MSKRYLTASGSKDASAASADVEDLAGRQPTLDQKWSSMQSLAVCFVVAMIVSIFAYAAGAGSMKTVDTTCSALLASMMIAVAVTGLVMGGLLGFLFGIPRLLSKEKSPAIPSKAPGARNFHGNTNLEEISDWLTKIIVGITLVQAGTIEREFVRLTEWFAVATGNAAGAGPMFAMVLASAVIVGFLYFYLETRTRLTLFLAEADDAVSARVIERGRASSAINASLGGVQALASTKAEAADEVDEDDLLAHRFDELTTPDEFAAWGAAQVRAGAFQAGIKAMTEAVSRDPSNRRYLILLAGAHLNNDNAKAALQVYAEARTRFGSDPVLLRHEMLCALYAPAPQGFTRALEAGEELRKADPRAEGDPMVALWTAAARGQQYDWLAKNRGTAPEKQTARDAALKEVKHVVAIRSRPDADVRILMRQITDPVREKSALWNNDLEVFKDDPEFAALIFG